MKLQILALCLILISCGHAQQNRSSVQSRDDNPVVVGQKVFEKHCQSCHLMPSRDEIMFAEVLERLPEPSESYFVKFIQDSKGLKASGDGYARALDETFEVDYEHAFDELTENQIQSMIAFIRSKSEKGRRFK